MRKPLFLAVRFWPANPWRDGGTKRSAQIDACIRVVCPEATVVEVVLPLSLGWRQAILVLLQPRSWLDLFRLRRFNLRLALRGGRDAAILRSRLSELEGDVKAVVWEATMSAGVVLATDKPIIGFPHNMEALNEGGRQMLGCREALPALKEEIGLLRKCHRLYFIAKEEACLARNLGLSSDYLPYYPPDMVCAKLEKIRRRRQVVAPGDEFLILGSATNIPTARAVETLLVAIHSRHDISDRKFIVCGSGTEKYAREGRDNVEVRGRVSEEELTNLLETCRAAIVFQEEGSGMLTRITELLLSGVPVVANLHAARSTENHAGLWVAADVGGVLELIKRCSFPATCGAISSDSVGLDGGLESLRKEIRKIAGLKPCE